MNLTRNILRGKRVGLVWAASLLITVTGCENFLDLAPTDSIPAEGAISDEATAEAAIMGAYNKVQDYYAGYYVTLGVMPADNVEYNGTLTEYLQLDQNAVSTDNRATVSAYTGIYEAINTANSIIDGLEKLDDAGLAEESKRQLLGEAYFIRALGYFDLARAWGGVQIQLKPTTDLSVIAGIKRSSREDTYRQVEADLEQAEELLPEDDGLTRDRARKNAARALRARLYLYTEQWEEAERYASEVIADTQYTLVKPFSLFFTPPFQTEESVFELRFSSNNKNGYWDNWYPSSLGGDYTLKPSAALVSKLLNPQVGGSRKAIVAGEGNEVYGVLYNTVSTSTDPIYVIRIAEMYLTRAEARAKKASPDVEGALADLNAVRGRADVPPLTQTDNAGLVRAIEEERGIELAFEGHRWFDLTRTSRAGELLGVTDTNYWLFPLPSSDILSDPDVTQNPGY